MDFATNQLHEQKTTGLSIPDKRVPLLQIFQPTDKTSCCLIKISQYAWWGYLSDEISELSVTLHTTPHCLFIHPPTALLFLLLLLQQFQLLLLQPQLQSHVRQTQLTLLYLAGEKENFLLQGISLL